MVVERAADAREQEVRRGIVDKEDLQHVYGHGWKRFRVHGFSILTRFKKCAKAAFACLQKKNAFPGVCLQEAMLQGKLRLLELCRNLDADRNGSCPAAAGLTDQPTAPTFAQRAMVKAHDNISRGEGVIELR